MSRTVASEPWKTTMLDERIESVPVSAPVLRVAAPVSLELLPSWSVLSCPCLSVYCKTRTLLPGGCLLVPVLRVSLPLSYTVLECHCLTLSFSSMT